VKDEEKQNKTNNQDHESNRGDGSIKNCNRGCEYDQNTL
jgi:hypothetical protein